VRVHGPHRETGRADAHGMTSQRRRLLSYLALVVFVLVVYTLVYDWGMSALENRPRTPLESLVVVVETFTTTGYGEDTPWSSPGMQLIMVGMQLTGVTLIFLALPLFVAPWVEERLGRTVPTSVDLEDHVVICGFSSRGEALIEELEVWDREYVIVDPDRERTADLLDDHAVIKGDLESIDTLRDANVGAADVVVADATDEVNASIVLSAREVGNGARVIAIAEDPDMAEYLEYAGADEVFTPRQLLGEGLANEVTAAVSSELGDTIEIGSDFELAELPVQGGCGIDGTTLQDSGIRERTGASVIGMWHRGAFVASPDPERVLDSDTILLVSGTEDQLAALKRLTLSEVRRRARGTVVVAGYGEVGSGVSRAIAASEMDGTVIDRVEHSGVDVVGDATSEAVLREAGVPEADSLVLALADDTTTMLATLVARELSESVRIVARADEEESVGKLYRAGADYVLALSTVSGRIVASSVLEEEEIIAPEARLVVARTSAPRLAGESLGDADIRSRTGCTVVAIERDGEVFTDLGPEFVIESGDTLVVAGTDEAVNAFTEIAR